MELKNILNWSDPSLSGIVFGSGLVFLVSLSYFSLLSVIAYLALALLFLGIGCKVYVHLMGALKKPCKDPLAKIEVMDLEISNETLEKLLDGVVELFNKTSAQLRSLYTELFRHCQVCCALVCCYFHRIHLQHPHSPHHGLGPHVCHPNCL